MKRILAIGTLGTVALGGVYGLVHYSGTAVTAVNAPQTVEIVTEVDALDARIKAAIEAKSAEIHDAGEKARLDAENQLRTEIELEVRQAYRQELEAVETELEKATGEY